MKKIFTFIFMLFLVTSFVHAEVVLKRTFNEEEKKTTIEFFENNKLIAKQIFYVDELESEEGKIPDGIVNEFYESGELKQEENYRNNRLDGLQKSYYENGNLSSEGMMKNGKIVGQTKQYYENGQLWGELNWKDGKLTGISKGYYESGELHKETHHSDDSYVPKLGKEYYKDGKLKHEFETNIIEGEKRFSIDRDYDKNGKLIKEEKTEMKFPWEK